MTGLAGSLAVVGAGIRTLSQLTPEARAAIGSADIVHVLVPDAVAGHAIATLATAVRDLADLYELDRDRITTYQMMQDRILGDVRAGKEVCAVFYGHPGVFVDPSHPMIAAARNEGYSARMFPGISAADCLYADLGLDPGSDGIQMYSATDFLLKQRIIDPRVPLVLWQMAFIGASSGITEPAEGHLDLLVDALHAVYPLDHEVLLYEASTLPGYEPIVIHLPIRELASAELRMAMTLVVPPTDTAAEDPVMLERLGLEPIESLRDQ